VAYGARAAGRAKIRPDDRLVLHDVELSGADFSRRKLLQLSVAGSRLTSCRFEEVRATAATLGGGTKMSQFVECSLDRSRLTLGPGGYARFERCSFRNVDLRHWFCSTVELVDCTFSGRLQKAIFNGTVPEDRRALAGRIRNEYSGNDFSSMDLVDVAFRSGVDLTLQRLPVGPQYLYVGDAAGSVERARSAVVGWDDLTLRREAMALIGIFEEDIERGQRQLFLRKDDFSGPKEALNALFALLAGE
jgi:hypothetical protein